MVHGWASRWSRWELRDSGFVLMLVVCPRVVLLIPMIVWEFVQSSTLYTFAPSFRVNPRKTPLIHIDGRGVVRSRLTFWWRGQMRKRLQNLDCRMTVNSDGP